MERKAKEDESDPKMEGYLEKKRKSRLVSLWHRYWFILEGAHLSYYENRPSSATSPCKGSFTLTPMTSVTASNPSRTSSAHHLGNCEIYILNQTNLITLRTRDFDEHRIWMRALLEQTALLANKQSRVQITVQSPSNVVTGPLQYSNINFRHSLTSLTANEGKDNASSLKSHTLEYKDPNISKFKSGSTGNMINKQISKDNSVTDGDISSEEEEDVFDKLRVIGSDQGTEWSMSTDRSPPILHDDANPKISDEEGKKRNVLYGYKFLERPNLTNVADSEEASSDKQLIRSVDSEKISNVSRISQLQEAKPIQTQEHKIKSRKFFHRRDSKTNDVPTSCKKVYKKYRESLSADKGVHNSKSLIKDEQKSKFEECHPKDDTAFEKGTASLKSSHLSNDSKIQNDYPSSSSESQPLAKNEGTKSPNKAKKKKDKNKKDNKVNEPSFEVRNNRKSKLAKANEMLEDGETKTKIKKTSFFSKLVKCKRGESQEDKVEEIEENQKLELCEDPETPDDESSNVSAKRISPEEKRKLHVTNQRLHFGLKLIPTDDAELQRKLHSRMLKMDSNQEPSSQINISPDIKRKLPVLIPRIKDTDMKNSNPVDSHDGDNTTRPLLPPRIPLRAPTLHDRSNNSFPLVTLRSLPPENISLLNSKSGTSPKLYKKYQIPEAETWRNYDHVKFKVKNIESGFPKPTISDSCENHVESQTVVINESVHLSSVSPNLQEVYDKNADFDIERPAVQEVDDKNIDIQFEKAIDMPVNPTFSEMLKPSSSNNKQFEDEKDDAPSDSSPIQMRYSSSLSEMDEKTFHKVDELGFLLSELDRINSSPLENANSGENQRPLSEEIKRVPSVGEFFLAAYPIRRRRNSDPDYDIPRPHRLPKHHQLSTDGDDDPSSGKDAERRSREWTDSIVIEATCFLGPGMDQSFNENRYYGLNNNNWNEKNDKIEHQSSEVGIVNETDYFGGNSNVNLDRYGEVYDENAVALQKDGSDSRLIEDSFYETGRNASIASENSEESVHLRVGNIDRVCRTERSREVYESDLENYLNLNESMETLSITKRQDETESTKTSENDSSLRPDVSNDEFKERNSIKNLEEGFTKTADSDEVEDDGLLEQFEFLTKFNQTEAIGGSLSSANDKRKQQEIHVELDAEEPEVLLRKGHALERCRSDKRDNRTLRLSFATTETLIVEEEVLVASLKTTTTTTTFSSSAEDLSEKKENVEEFVDEVILEMDKISDDHFGSMQIQSCVQT